MTVVYGDEGDFLRGSTSRIKNLHPRINSFTNHAFFTWKKTSEKIDDGIEIERRI
jgi:hypothetical protein